MENKPRKEPFKHQVYSSTINHILWPVQESLGFFQQFPPLQGMREKRKKRKRTLPKTVKKITQTELGAALQEGFLSHFNFYPFGEEK